METAMLVEAGPKRRKLLSELLEEEGLNVESVKTAEEALSRAAKSAPGLVLLDINMPTVSGLEALEQLRIERRLRELPLRLPEVPFDADQPVAHRGAESSGCSWYGARPSRWTRCSG